VGSTSGRREVVGKEGRRVTTVQKCAHMPVNAKLRPVETVPGTGEGDTGERWRGEFNMMCVIYCKNLHKCHNAPPPSTRIKKENKYILYI
jgi:hypothetical protein